MSEPLSPQDSLQHYFDDLLQDEDAPSLAMPRQPQTQTQPQIASKPAPTPTPDFADAESERQQKLQRLLQSAPRSVAPVPAPVLADEIQDWEIESPASVELVIHVAAPLEGADLSQVDEASADEGVAEEMPGLEWLPNGRPIWAQARFDVLLFKVSGLTLAVPLIALGQIQPITDELTPLFGQADWFMGLQPTPAGKIRTVNTAKFVMPERYDESFVKTARYVVSINGVPWGLAVDSVNQPIRLEPEDVKWRSERSKRPWLAGTVKAHMCALLDIPRFGQLLLDADRNWRKSPKRA